MEYHELNGISPFVRMVKIQKASYLSGEWIDHDNVFTYIAEGEADFILDGIQYHLKGGNVIVMPPYLKHLVRSTSTIPLVQYTFHFDLFYDRERSLLTKIGVAAYDHSIAVREGETVLKAIAPVTYINHPEQPYLKNRFHIMHKEYLDQKPGVELMIKSIAIELLAIYLRNQSNHAHVKSIMTKSWAMLEKAITYINKNYSNEELDNVQISQFADVTPNYLSQAFKKHLGIPMHSYVNHIRIERAKELILKRDQKLTEVASSVGFSGIHVFSKIFKKTVGMTPSEFLASNTIQKENAIN